MQSIQPEGSSQGHLPSSFQPALGQDKNFLRAKTSHRMQYEAEAQVLRTKLGGLEGVRRNLGFSRRKLCQSLLVDPSAWSRWTKDESKVPPHIWRALQWMAALQEKYPDLPLVLKSSVESQANFHDLTSSLQALSRDNESLQKQIRLLKSQIVESTDLVHPESRGVESELPLSSIQPAKSPVSLGWKLLLIINTAVLVYLFIRLI